MLSIWLTAGDKLGFWTVWRFAPLQKYITKQNWHLRMVCGEDFTVSINLKFYFVEINKNESIATVTVFSNFIFI